MDTVLGLDVGGSKISAVVLTRTGEVLHRSWTKHATRSSEDLFSALDRARVAASRELEARQVSFVATGVGLAGWMTRDRRRITLAANLGISDLDVAATLRENWRMPVHLENDGTAAALGEHRFGESSGRSLALFTLGTGVGGGIVVDDKPLIGAHGLAAEFGHIPVDLEAGHCECGGRGCLELAASGPAVARAAGMTSSSEVVASANAGDSTSRRVLHDAGHALGLAIVMITAAIDPDRVFLAGSFAHSASAFLLPAIAQVQQAANPLGNVRKPPTVGTSTVGPYVGAYGAAALALASGDISVINSEESADHA